ncbi:MAG: heat repeat protein [Cyanobacteria bacterium RYN_339]|nr:heat repeat protein [Cyanobacteria bacterium RYN_339]
MPLATVPIFAAPLASLVRHAPNVQLQVVAWLGWGLLILTGILVILILVMRFRLSIIEARARRFNALWRPLLMKGILDYDVHYPPVHPTEWLMLFSLWNHLHESFRGEARRKLNDFARENGMDKVARSFLESTSVRKRLIGLIALGNLKHAASWNNFKELLEDESSMLSLAALRGLLLTDARRAMPIVIPAIATREDWSPVRVASFLESAGTDIVAVPLARAALKMDPREGTRLVKYLAAMDAVSAVPIIREILEVTKHDALIAACLPMLRGFEDLATIRNYVRHPVWYVRVQAATMLGKLGVPGDEDYLLLLLNDREWWVRYRAARALANMAFLSDEDLARIRERQEGFAKDMLNQAYAEGPFR